MKIVSNRTLLLGTIFVIMIMAIFFALTPSRRTSQRASSLPNKLSDTEKSVIKSEKPSATNKELKTMTVWKNRQTEHSAFVMGTEESLKIAKEMFQKNGVVLFTMINDAYFDFAASWCCNTAPMGNIHKLSLFLTTDISTGKKLQSFWPLVTVVALNTTKFAGSQEYSKAGYVRMMVERTRFIFQLLKAGIKLLLFEVDCLWLEDPLPTLFSQQSEGDILATKVTGKDVTAGGFLLLNPTKATVMFWHRLTDMMDGLFRKVQTKQDMAPVSEGENDQEFFSSLTRQKYAGIKLKYLPAERFPDGKWYQLSEKIRSRKPYPILINNNWVNGNAAKIRRARSFGHWFWDQSAKTCNSTAVRHLFPSQG